MSVLAAGYFQDPARAAAARKGLIARGFAPAGIEELVHRPAEQVVAEPGRLTGGEVAATGSITGLLVGEAALLVPAARHLAGPTHVGAALAVALLGGIVGGAVGGAISALQRWSPRSMAGRRAAGDPAGTVLLVHGEPRYAEARQILAQHGAALVGSLVDAPPVPVHSQEMIHHGR